MQSRVSSCLQPGRGSFVSRFVLLPNEKRRVDIVLVNFALGPQGRNRAG